jgi:hypothetical protein
LWRAGLGPYMFSRLSFFFLLFSFDFLVWTFLSNQWRNKREEDFIPVR